jgi:hypothetical protein
MVMETVTIPIEVTPDLIVLKSEKEKYGDKIIHKKYAYIFSHEMCFVKNTDADGNYTGYSDPEFFAIRFKDGKVQIMNNKHGWLVDSAATEKYFEIQAEKDLLK